MEIEPTDETDGVSSIVGAEMGTILFRPPLSATDDFFDCGGDSLRAVDLVGRLTSRWRPDEGPAADRMTALLITAIFDDPSPRHLAAMIEAEVGFDSSATPETPSRGSGR
ncbi:phosphopantetheine-binding protein [Nocardia asteroides]|uniref:phosphopantetheine-binding protein n=1 Tax=Nocardia asteroides TaxID=1824 RepID=UPI001E49CAAC|nr:phosphopantetheine-binding protein [Nocardia asteroides]UGT61034.1 phosphopantetheine-binding protein [Nocardia asteroides]